MQPVSPASAVSFPDTAGTLPLLPRAAVLLGWWLRESTGAAVATVEIRDGGSAAGQLLAEITLAAGASVRDTLGPVGLEARGGVTVVVTAGTARGGVWTVLE